MFIKFMNKTTNRVFSILCIVALAFQVNALVSSVCDYTGMIEKENAATAHNVCCITSRYIINLDTAETCESCSSCLACEQEQKSPENSVMLSRVIEHNSTFRTVSMLPFQIQDVSVVNDKHIDFDLVTRIQLPPSSPVLLI